MILPPPIRTLAFVLLGAGLLLGGCRPAPAPVASPTPTTLPTQAPTASAAESDQTGATPTAAQPEATQAAAPSPTAAAPAEPTPAAADEAVQTPAAAPTRDSSAGAESVSPTSVVASAATDACTPAAAFIADLTIPDGTLMRQGETFTKSWRVRNNGTCAWDSRYALVYSGGENMNGPQSSPLPVVAPGETADLTLELTAPGRGGTHTGYWRFASPDGSSFGVSFPPNDPIWVEIAVTFVEPTGAPGSLAPTPEPVASGGEAAGEPSTTGGSPTAACPVQRDRDFENQVLALINTARAQNGLQALALKSGLSAAALAHTQDMACYDNISHVGTDGSSWYDRVAAQGYPYSVARENIYVGSPDFGGTPQGAFDWWMNSQIHRDNILAADIESIGIAYVFTPSGQYGGYYTLVFARP